MSSNALCFTVDYRYGVFHYLGPIASMTMTKEMTMVPAVAMPRKNLSVVKTM